MWTRGGTTGEDSPLKFLAAAAAILVAGPTAPRYTPAPFFPWEMPMDLWNASPDDFLLGETEYALGSRIEDDDVLIPIRRNDPIGGTVNQF